MIENLKPSLFYRLPVGKKPFVERIDLARNSYRSYHKLTHASIKRLRRLMNHYNTHTEIWAGGDVHLQITSQPYITLADYIESEIIPELAGE